MKKGIEKDLKTGYRSPLLPGHLEEKSYRSALEFDKYTGIGDASDEVLKSKVMTHGGTLMDQLFTLHFKDVITLGWPSSLYIPGSADWKNYWILPPPPANRYSQSWTPTPPSTGFGTSSFANGTLFDFQQIMTNEQFVFSDTGLGVLFTPARTLSVVSFEPQVDCSGEHRWWAEFGPQFLVAGSSRVKTSLILAVWQQIPGPAGWDLLNWKLFDVADSFPNSGLGHGMVTPYQKSFTGTNLAAPFLVQSGRTYLFGVVARVSVWSSYTDSHGHPLPRISDGSFRVWGTLACVIPQIEIIEKQVHIP
jgi:hypothetical protein